MAQQQRRELRSSELGVQSSELGIEQQLNKDCNSTSTRFQRINSDSTRFQRINSELRTQNSEFEKVGAAVRSGHSVLVLGEAGTGKSEFAQALYETFLGELDTAIATYKGSSKKFFASIAFQLDIPTENEDGKPLTMDALKDEIAENCGDNTLLIFPEAKRLTTGIRYWLAEIEGSCNQVQPCKVL